MQISNQKQSPLLPTGPENRVETSELTSTGLSRLSLISCCIGWKACRTVVRQWSKTSCIDMSPFDSTSKEMGDPSSPKKSPGFENSTPLLLTVADAFHGRKNCALSKVQSWCAGLMGLRSCIRCTLSTTWHFSLNWR
jgi:hypothetical protein